MRYRVVTGLILSVLTLPAQTPNRAPLTPNAFDPLPLGSVKPAGWLLQQLKIQRDGLTGHIDEFWPDLSSTSAWLGGKGEGWERGPYYLDGLVPLAYLLDDPELIGKARRWLNWTLEHQREDGSIGPEKNQDWWPDMIMLKVLTQFQEVTGDPRVIPALEKFFAYQARNIEQNLQRNGRFTVGETSSTASSGFIIATAIRSCWTWPASSRHRATTGRSSSTSSPSRTRSPGRRPIWKRTA